MPVRDKIAEAFAAVDDVSTRQQEAVRARTFELMFDPVERDAALFFDAFDAAGVDPEMWIGVTPDDLNEVDPRDRTIDWMAVQAAMAAAAIQQARLELVYRDIIAEAMGGAVSIIEANAGLTNDQRRVAATEGTGRARFDAATEARRGGRP